MMKKIYILGLFLGMGVGVANADLYRVEGIPISAELNSVTEARSAAIENGETDAFWALMKKMVDQDNLQQVPIPAEPDLRRWVQTVSLSNEKHTNTKYMADLSVRFDDVKIQEFLTQNRIPFLTKDLPDTVIVPIIQKNETVLSLDEQNPLYAYLKENTPKNEIWKIHVPVGDLEEIMRVQEAVQNGHLSDLGYFADKYGADSVMLVRLNQQGPYVTAQITHIPVQPALDQQVEIIASNGQIKSVIPNLWRRIEQSQEEKWRQAKTQNFEMAMLFWAQAPIRNLRDWTALYTKLKKADFINNLSVRGFRPNEVWVTFSYLGTSMDLNRQLRPLGLKLDVGDQNGVWQLLPTGGI